MPITETRAITYKCCICGKEQTYDPDEEGCLDAVERVYYLIRAESDFNNEAICTVCGDTIHGIVERRRKTTPKEKKK